MCLSAFSNWYVRRWSERAHCGDRLERVPPFLEHPQVVAAWSAVRETSSIWGLSFWGPCVLTPSITLSSESIMQLGMKKSRQYAISLMKCHCLNGVPLGAMHGTIYFGMSDGVWHERQWPHSRDAFEETERCPACLLQNNLIRWSSWQRCSSFAECQSARGPKPKAFPSWGWIQKRKNWSADLTPRAASRVNNQHASMITTFAAVPGGIDDLRHTQGKIESGVSTDTPECAVDCIHPWWTTIGQNLSHTDDLIILAESGGSNGYRPWAWTSYLQTKWAAQNTLRRTVAPDPSGASKWNPLEHRLFCEVSKNWAGIALTDIDTILNLIKWTPPQTGLAVSAYPVKGAYQKGLKTSDQQKRDLGIEEDRAIPKGNYTLQPWARKNDLSNNKNHTLFFR